MQERKTLSCTERERKWKNLPLEENVEILRIERNRKRNMYNEGEKDEKKSNRE